MLQMNSYGTFEKKEGKNGRVWPPNVCILVFYNISMTNIIVSQKHSQHVNMINTDLMKFQKPDTGG